MAGRVVIRLSVRSPGEPGRITGFRFLWAYTVTGYDPTRHCQPGLHGTRAASFHSRNATTGDYEFTIPAGAFLYVCGVAAGPKHLLRERNLHLPLRPSPGASGSAMSYNGYTFAWEGATRIAIPEPVPRPDLPEAHYRCANFRVAEAWFADRDAQSSANR